MATATTLVSDTAPFGAADSFLLKQHIGQPLSGLAGAVSSAGCELPSLSSKAATGDCASAKECEWNGDSNKPTAMSAVSRSRISPLGFRFAGSIASPHRSFGPPASSTRWPLSNPTRRRGHMRMSPNLGCSTTATPQSRTASGRVGVRVLSEGSRCPDQTRQTDTTRLSNMPILWRRAMVNWNALIYHSPINGVEGEATRTSPGMVRTMRSEISIGLLNCTIVRGSSFSQKPSARRVRTERAMLRISR